MVEREESGPEPGLWWLCLCLQVVPKCVALGTQRGQPRGVTPPSIQKCWSPGVLQGWGVLSPPLAAWLRVALAKVCQSRAVRAHPCPFLGPLASFWAGVAGHGHEGLRSPWPTSLPTWLRARGRHVLFIRRIELALPCSLRIPVGEASGGLGEDAGGREKHGGDGQEVPWGGVQGTRNPMGSTGNVCVRSESS